MPLILDRSVGRDVNGGAPPLTIDFSGITPDRVAGRSLTEIAHMKITADGHPCEVGEVCVLQGSSADGRIECRGDFSRVHWVGAAMPWGEMVIASSVGRHAGEAMRGGRLSIGGDAGDWLAAELLGGTIHVAGNAGDNAAAALPGSPAGVRGGMVIVEGRAGALAGARMRRGILAIGGDCGPAAGFELRAGTVFVVGIVGPHAALGMQRGSLIAASDPPEIAPLFRRGAVWSPPFLPLLAASLRRAGFVAIDRIRDAFGGPWQHWHADPLAGGRGEIFHRCPPQTAVS